MTEPTNYFLKLVLTAFVNTDSCIWQDFKRVIPFFLGRYHFIFSRISYLFFFFSFPSPERTTSPGTITPKIPKSPEPTRTTLGNDMSLVDVLVHLTVKIQCLSFVMSQSLFSLDRCSNTENLSEFGSLVASVVFDSWPHSQCIWTQHSGTILYLARWQPTAASTSCFSQCMCSGVSNTVLHFFLREAHKFNFRLPLGEQYSIMILEFLYTVDHGIIPLSDSSF